MLDPTLSLLVGEVTWSQVANNAVVVVFLLGCGALFVWFTKD